jgi:hypothetical protein
VGDLSATSGEFLAHDDELPADPAATQLVRKLNVGQARTRERNEGCHSLR